MRYIIILRATPIFKTLLNINRVKEKKIKRNNTN